MHRSGYKKTGGLSPVEYVLFPEIHHRTEEKRSDDRAFAQRPFHAEDQRDGDADDDQRDIDLLPQAAHGRVHPVCKQLDEAFHRGAHQVRLQHERAAEGADGKRGKADDYTQRIEGERDVFQDSIEEEIEHGAAQRDVKELEKLSFAEVFALDGDLTEEEAAVEEHRECTDLHADQDSDGGDGGVDRQYADGSLDSKSDSAVNQKNAQNGARDLLKHMHFPFVSW